MKLAIQMSITSYEDKPYKEISPEVKEVLDKPAFFVLQGDDDDALIKKAMYNVCAVLAKARSKNDDDFVRNLQVLKDKYCVVRTS